MFSDPRLGPAFRRGALLSVPIAIALTLELPLGLGTVGAASTGALLGGFVALDAGAPRRALWQACFAPLIGISAALGVLTTNPEWLAVLAITLLGAAAGYSGAVSKRMGMSTLVLPLAMLLTQGFNISPGDAPKALYFGIAGGLMQAVFSLLVALTGDRAALRVGPLTAGVGDARDACAKNLTIRSHHCRHAIRWGVALGVATATYRALGLDEHGYWVPLTVLFVLKPERDDTLNRILLRALGTVAGLVLATGLAEAFGGDDVILVVIMCAATTGAYALLAIQYAFFTAAITIFAVVLADALGESATEAAKQRGVATAIGLMIAALAFVLWSNHGTDPIFADPAAAADSG